MSNTNITRPTNLQIAVLISALFLSGCKATVSHTSAAAAEPAATTAPTATPAATATPFATAMEGIWKADMCFALNGWGLTSAMNFSSGTFSQLLFAYPGDVTCSVGNPAIMNGDTFSLVTDWAAGNAIVEPSISGLPDNLYIIGEAPDFSAIYKTSTSHAQFLVTTSTSNWGATYAAWAAGDLDLVGLLANPLTFVATVMNSVNIPLNKISFSIPAPSAPTLVGLSGIWSNPGCLADTGNGTSAIPYRNISSDGSMYYFEENWTNTTCAGPVSAFYGPIAITVGIGAAVSNGSYELNYTAPSTAYTLIQKSGDFLFFGHSINGAADDGSTAPKRHSAIEIDYAYKSETAPTSATLVGTWVSNCLDDGDGTSTKVSTTYTHPSTYNFSAIQEHWESNTTCSGGADITDAPITGTYSIGTNYKNGYKYDISITSGPNIYYTAWFHGNYLYVGLPNGDANDASSDGLRSSTLSTGFYYTKQ